MDQNHWGFQMVFLWFVFLFETNSHLPELLCEGLGPTLLSHVQCNWQVGSCVFWVFTKYIILPYYAKRIISHYGLQWLLQYSFCQTRMQSGAACIYVSKRSKVKYISLFAACVSFHSNESLPRVGTSRNWNSGELHGAY